MTPLAERFGRLWDELAGIGRSPAAQAGGVATLGKAVIVPNGTNAIPSAVDAWLDARAAADATLDEVVSRIAAAAGHDAGILSAHVPAAMLFVRNPTGVSHSPSEHAEAADCVAGVTALTAVLEDLACR